MFSDHLVVTITYNIKNVLNFVLFLPCQNRCIDGAVYGCASSIQGRDRTASVNGEWAAFMFSPTMTPCALLYSGFPATRKPMPIP